MFKSKLTGYMTKLGGAKRGELDDALGRALAGHRLFKYSTTSAFSAGVRPSPK